MAARGIVMRGTEKEHICCGQPLLVLWPRFAEEAGEERLRLVLSGVLATGRTGQMLRTAEELQNFLEHKHIRCGQRLLAVCAVGEYGINLELYRMLEVIRRRGCCLPGTFAGIIVDGSSEFYTKAVGREIAFTLNQAGSTLIGRPLVEGTGSLSNLLVTARNQNRGLMEAYRWSAKDLTERLAAFRMPQPEKPEILCLNASNAETSNTIALWKMVRGHLEDRIGIREISLRNGQIRDCAGCSYDTCMYFSRKSTCYYGGTIAEEVYPAMEHCSALLLLCPNYNDALGANLTAFINRLTALFRKQPFSEKLLFSIIVSGYSGSDLLAKQLIDGLCMNKSFILPSGFALTETANEKGSVLRIEGIEKEAEEYAAHILELLCPELPGGE
ncbi:MAG: NAD(P)H-dependent oxidoreductase [Lachnospiraceae bacterium]|nr:NAD(P)H-dependent oxidoreductase [Lachnospiraceae bacterium]